MFFWLCNVWETYMSILTMYVVEYTEQNKRDPEWYHYFVFLSQVIVYCLSYLIFLVTLKFKSSSKEGSDSVKVLNNRLLVLTYEWNGKEYKIQIPIDKMNASEFVKAEIGGGADGSIVVDVSKEIRPFMGPLEDWHGLAYTPASFGYSAVTITKMNSDSFEVTSKTYGSIDIF
jgi:hypothetical protein